MQGLLGPGDERMQEMLEAVSRHRGMLLLTCAGRQRGSVAREDSAMHGFDRRQSERIERQRDSQKERQRERETYTD